MADSTGTALPNKSASVDVESVMPELESSMDIDQFLANQEPETETTEEKEETTEESETETTEETEETTDTEEEEIEEETEEESKTKEKEKTPEQKAKKEELKKIVAPVWRKPIVAKDGEKEVQVPPTAVWEVKVDGKPQSVTTQELLTAYSSKSANDRARTEIISEKRTLETQIEQFNGIIENFAKKAEEGKALEAFADLVSATGKDPLTIVRKFRNEVIKTAREYLELSEEERRVLEIQEDNQYLQSKIQRTTEEQRREAEKAQLVRDIDLAISHYDLKDRDNFKQVYEHAKRYVVDQVKAGSMPRDFVITPDFVGRFGQSVRRSVLLDKVLTKTAPALKNDAEAIERLSQAIIAFNPDEDELTEVVKEFYAAPEAEQAAKVGNNGHKKTNVPLTKPSRKTQASQKEDEDDPGLDIDRTPNMLNWRRSK